MAYIGCILFGLFFLVMSAQQSGTLQARIEATMTWLHAWAPFSYIIILIVLISPGRDDEDYGVVARAQGAGRPDGEVSPGSGAAAGRSGRLGAERLAKGASPITLVSRVATPASASRQVTALSEKCCDRLLHPSVAVAALLPFRAATARSWTSRSRHSCPAILRTDFSGSLSLPPRRPPSGRSR